MKHKTFEELLKAIISEIFQADDMIDYLYQNLNLLDKRQIVDIVRMSYASIESKLEFFDELAAFEDKEELEIELRQAIEGGDAYEEEWVKKYSYTYQAVALKEAIKNLYVHDRENGILLLSEYMIYDGKDEIVETIPFYTYEKIDSYIKSRMEEEKEALNEYIYWYVVEKYEELENGRLDLRYTYYMLDGSLVYYADEKSNVDCDIWEKDLNIPVPFLPGDIVVCDGNPICKEVCAVILRIGNNIDCCSLVGLCKRENETLESVPVKHSNMFYESNTMIMVSPLYSMRRVKRQLTDEEPEMVRIANFIKGDEERGYIVENNLCELIVNADVTEILMENLEQKYQMWCRKHRR